MRRLLFLKKKKQEKELKKQELLVLSLTGINQVFYHMHIYKPRVLGWRWKQENQRFRIIIKCVVSLSTFLDSWVSFPCQKWKKGKKKKGRKEGKKGKKRKKETKKIKDETKRNLEIIYRVDDLRNGINIRIK